mmetsp:Transcript_52194/g.124905  ORF Transcript_52194/g.124905 Transcript_52194/m.124905 type:complete len:204 (-) Transcript_52194:1211-1822(-)
MRVMKISITAGASPWMCKGNGPCARNTDCMVQGIARARKTFWTLAPRAFATAMPAFPWRATQIPEKTLGKEVPAAATVKPSTLFGMSKALWMPSQAVTTRELSSPSHSMLIRKAKGYRCCRSGRSMSGIVAPARDVTGNCAQATHSLRKLQDFSGGRSADLRRRSISFSRRPTYQTLRVSSSASVLDALLGEMISSVMMFPNP